MLYLDIDDTLLSWASGEPKGVPASGRFVQWAMERFEIRWLTKWCPTGQMADELLGDLSKMLGVETAQLRGIRGCSWDESGIKVDGIAWLEHAVLGRDFAWVENREGVSDRDLEVLELAGYADRYFPCNVSEDESALDRAREHLERRFGGNGRPAPTDGT